VYDNDKTSTDLTYQNYDSSDNSNKYDIDNKLDQSSHNNFTSEVDVNKNKQFYIENDNQQYNYDISNTNTETVNEQNFSSSLDVYHDNSYTD
jgi:hypothetical protein